MTVLAGLGRADEEVQFDPLPVLAVAAESLDVFGPAAIGFAGSSSRGRGGPRQQALI